MIIYNFCVPLSKVVQHTECIILNHYFIISYSLVTYFVSPSRKVWWCTTLLEKKRVTGCPNSTPSRVCTQKLSPQQWVQFQPGPFTTCHHLFPHRKNIFFKRVKKNQGEKGFRKWYHCIQMYLVYVCFEFFWLLVPLSKFFLYKLYLCTTNARCCLLIIFITLALTTSSRSRQEEMW